MGIRPGEKSLLPGVRRGKLKLNKPGTFFAADLSIRKTTNRELINRKL